MSQGDRKEKGRFGLTAEEYRDLVATIRSGAIIVALVLITFLIVANLAPYFGL